MIRSAVKRSLSGAVNIGHERYAAETGDNLMQELKPFANKVRLLD